MLITGFGGQSIVPALSWPVNHLVKQLDSQPFNLFCQLALQSDCQLANYLVSCLVGCLDSRLGFRTRPGSVSLCWQLLLRGAERPDVLHEARWEKQAIKKVQGLGEINPGAKTEMMSFPFAACHCQEMAMCVHNSSNNNDDDNNNKEDVYNNNNGDNRNKNDNIK